MHLVALVAAADHVCCRYRLRAFRPWLEQAGHSLTLVPLPRSWWERANLFHKLRGESVILQRFLLPRWQLAYLRRRARHLVFDFDDAVFFRDSYSSKGMHHPRRLCRFIATVRAADAVVAGNRFLAEQAAFYTAPERVCLVPTCVEVQASEAGSPRREPREGETPAEPDAKARREPRPPSLGSRLGLREDGKTLVWIGSSSTLRGLENHPALLDALADAVPGVRLKVICDRFPTFSRLPVVPCPWNEATEADDLAAADVGISWIPDDAWSRGKCGLKVLQYAAAGLPVIANPVGVHPEMIRHGETGYLAATVGEWCDAVTRLCGDVERRQRMGEAGRARVRAQYSVERGASLWLDLLARLERRPVTRVR